eukprot:12914971-Prorocentrum_lima.AAC.1
MKQHTIEEPEWMLYSTGHYQYHKVVQAILDIKVNRKTTPQQRPETKIPWRLNADQELALQLQANFKEEDKEEEHKRNKETQSNQSIHT